MNGKDGTFLRVELHLHTCYSKDSLVPLEKLFERCVKVEIDRVAITDHNVIEGAFAAQAIAPERVIVGEEIQTTEGELIGYYMTEWVPPGLTPREAVARLRAQGAVISVPHPFDTVRSQHWDLEALEAIAPYVDAIETFNARCLSMTPNEQAAVFAREHGLLETVGSDAHSLMEVGQAALRLPRFEGPKEFKEALGNAQQEAQLSPSFVHLFSRFAVLRKKAQKARSDHQ